MTQGEPHGSARDRVLWRRVSVALVAPLAAAGLALMAQPASAADHTFTATVDNDTATAAPKTTVHNLPVIAGETVAAGLDWGTASANLTLILKRPDGTQAAIAATAQRPERLSHLATQTGNYRLNVVAATGGSAYTLNVTTSVQPPPPMPPTYLRTIGEAAHPAVAASGLDVDDAGNLYLADTGNDQVTSFAANGGQRWRVGARGSTANGSFSTPRDVAVAGGRVYVGDTGYNRVQVLDAATGQWLATWPHRFSALMGISAGVNERDEPIILVSDSTNQTVKTYTPGGTLQRTIGGGPGSGDGFFNQVRDAATAADGTIFTADFKNHRVQVFSATGDFVRKWGAVCPGDCPSPAPGQFKEPYGIQIDDAGDVYVSDNRRIQKFTPGGNYIRSYGSSGAGDDQFFQLRRVAVGSGDNPPVYGADLWGYKVLEFAQTGGITSTFGDGPPAPGGFNEPYGISIGADTVFVTDTRNQRIQEFSPATGAFQEAWSQRGFGSRNLSGVNWPRGVTYNAATNTVWVADTKNYRVTERLLDGTPTGRIFGTTGSVLMPSVLNWAYGITSYGSNVIVADTFGNKITRWTGNEATTPVWTATGFTTPKAVTVDGDVVYVADSVGHKIVKLDARTGARLGELGASVLHRVEGVAVAPNGNIWAADTSHNRLVELDPSGGVVRTFGARGTGNTQFNGPTQLAITTSGTFTLLYVVDSYNDRIQIYRIA